MKRSIGRCPVLPWLFSCALNSKTRVRTMEISQLEPHYQILESAVSSLGRTKWDVPDEWAAAFSSSLSLFSLFQPIPRTLLSQMQLQGSNKHMVAFTWARCLKLKYSTGSRRVKMIVVRINSHTHLCRKS